MSDKNKKKSSRLRTLLILFIGFVLAIAVFAAIETTVAHVTTSEFCGTTCHEMQGVYRGWKAGTHHDNSAGMAVACVDCHLPPKERYFKKLANEAYEGGKNLFVHFSGRPYDANAMQERVLKTMPDERCTKCHNNLLAKPSSTASRVAHETSLDKSDPNAPRCVESGCHAVMHERVADSNF